MARTIKFTNEYIIQLCNQKGLTFDSIHISNDKNGKSRKYVTCICNKHIEKGCFDIVCEKLESTKKPCPYCNHSKLKETFKDEMHIINPDIEILSDYKNWDTKIKCKCKKCNNIWDGRPSVLLYGGGCEKCGRIKIWDSRGRITTKDAMNKISTAHKNIKMIGEYKGSHSKTLFQCNIHNTTWESYYSNVLNGTCTCPDCAYESMNKRLSLSNEDFLDRLFNDYPYITPCEEYVNNETEMKLYCNIHNTYFNLQPRYLLYHKVKGCPECSKSLGETKMIKTLTDLQYNIKTQYIFPDCIYKRPLKFDGYDIINNIAYEYQGEQHYRPVNFNGISIEKSKELFKLTQERDNVKRLYCNTHNIPLIEIPYWEYDDMKNYIINQIANIKQ